MFEHDEEPTNTSGNRPFHEVLGARLSRRTAIAGGGAAVAATFVASTAVAGATTGAAAPAAAAGHELIGFTPVTVADNTGPEPSIAEEYQWQPLIPWGTPIQPGGPEFSWPQTSASDQEQQVGIGHDGMWYFPVNGSRRGMIAINHEFGRTTHVLGKSFPETLEDVRIMQAAHGVSVIMVRDNNGTWEPIRSGRNRRITVNTPVDITGPVSKSKAVLSNPAGNMPAGTVNNCANGYTPWGTYLTCEENFNGYFGSTDDTWTPSEEDDRYGFTQFGFGYGWHFFDPRFDLSNPAYENERNRFGYIVEIDPSRPKSKPAKRTALGRFKHEGIALTEGKNGRVVGYMGDDQRFDYIYKFVSERNWRAMRAAGVSPLNKGALYVARFDEDGTGEWLELTIDNPALAERFEDQAEVLAYARIAADILGATPMDRPEWTTVAPNGDVYCACTNNSRREEPNAANPLAPNADGHIIKWTDADDHVGLTFDWEIAIIAETTHGTEASFSDPDGLWADPDGRLFIQTDGGQQEGMNNQMLVMDTDPDGDMTPKRLFGGVTSDEITGIAVTPNRKVMFINTQHPGNGNPEATNFPAATDGVTVPRDSTIVLTRKDGGIIGS